MNIYLFSYKYILIKIYKSILNLQMISFANIFFYWHVIVYHFFFLLCMTILNKIKLDVTMHFFRV